MTRPPRKSAARPAAPLALPGWVVVAVVVALVGFTQRHVLSGWFALDDLVMFQQATGVRPWPLTVWRWLSGSVWFRAVVPLWGQDPLPYHLMSLALHVGNSLLLFALARRWGAGPLAAMVGAALFGMSRLHHPTLLAATSIGELLALGLVLAALLVAAPGRRAWVSAALVALAVSAKESALLLPFAALLVPREREEGARALRPALVTGVLAGAALLLDGIASGRLGGTAYAVSLGANLVQNAARLAGWSLDLVDPIPDLHATATGVGAWLPLLVLVALAAWALRARPLLRAGAAWWWLAVLPVLPLPGRTYLHYLHAPLAGLALVVAALVQALLERRGATAPGRIAWTLAGAGLLVFALWNDVLLATRLDLRMPVVDWPLDPVTRKSEVARRAVTDTRAALAGGRADIAILIPASLSRNLDLGSGRVADEGPVKRYELEAVLDGGASLRALVPGADSVVFVHDFEPGREGWLYLISRADAHLVSLGLLPGAHAGVVRAMLAGGLAGPALDYADKACAALPEDPVLAALRAQAAAAAAAAR